MRRLIFSIATNGYDKHFAGCLQSQRRFAEKVGAQYWVATGAPPWKISAHQSAWLKIPLCLHALKLGYDEVCFLDSDCEVRIIDWPWSEAKPLGDVRVAHDFSGRINAGVIFVRNTLKANQLLKKVLQSAWVPGWLLPMEDRNAYENGHVIHHWKNETGVQMMDPRLNWATEDGQENALIRHYGGWTARPASNTKALRFKLWRRRVIELFTAPMLRLNAFYYQKKIPKPYDN
jgi:hypothetical protein